MPWHYSSLSAPSYSCHRPKRSGTCILPLCATPAGGSWIRIPIKWCIPIPTTITLALVQGLRTQPEDIITSMQCTVESQVLIVFGPIKTTLLDQINFGGGEDSLSHFTLSGRLFHPKLSTRVVHDLPNGTMGNRTYAAMCSRYECLGCCGLFFGPEMKINIYLFLQRCA